MPKVSKLQVSRGNGGSAAPQPSAVPEDASKRVRKVRDAVTDDAIVYLIGPGDGSRVEVRMSAAAADAWFDDRMDALGVTLNQRAVACAGPAWSPKLEGGGGLVASESANA